MLFQRTYFAVSDTERMNTTKPLFVRPLTDSERQTLAGSLRSPDAFVLRRAQIVLASAAGERSGQIAPRVKGADDIAHGLPAEADAGRDHADRLALGAGQDDLGPPEDKGVGRAQAVLQGLALRVRRRTDDQWCFSHTRSMPLIKPSDGPIAP